MALYTTSPGVPVNPASAVQLQTYPHAHSCALTGCGFLSQVREAVMATIAAVQLEDLPVVVKFILHSVSASDASEVRNRVISASFQSFFDVIYYKTLICLQVVSNLRKKLELEQCVLPPVLQASQSRMKSKSAAGWEATSQYQKHLFVQTLFSLTMFCYFRSASKAASGGSQDSVTLILDCIKSAVRFQKTISEAWLKVC